MKRKLIISFITLFILGCTTYQFMDWRILIKNDTKRVNSIITSVNTYEKFCLSEIPTCCETVYVMTPYSEDFFEQKHLELFSCVKKELTTASLNEGICQLLFVYNGKVVSYAVVPRNVADFSRLRPDKFKKNATLFLDEKKIVHIK